MRVTILTCNTGQGHNSCAKAIQEVFDSHGDVCQIADALGFISKGFSDLVAWGHVTMYRHFPGMFRWSYGYTERCPASFEEGAIIYRLLSSGTDRLRSFLAEGEYDTVICTHVFSAVMLTIMLKKAPMKLETCFVDTDYTFTPGVQESRMDHYFIPDEELRQECIRCGIPPERIVCSGIPIRQVFYRQPDRNAAKQALGIREDTVHLLMMCGSMGCGPMEKLLDILRSRAEGICEITVVRGTNERLRRRLERKYAAMPSVHVRGYVESIAPLMRSADLYLTKPGGISVTEAAAMELPMVFINAVAGCEAYNGNFFRHLGGGETGDSVEDLASKCFQLLTDGEKRSRMRQTLAQRGTKNSAELIYQTMSHERK